MNGETRQRRGEQIGWLGGWIGTFCWIPALAVMFLVRGQIAAGGGGLVLFLVALALIFIRAPWRHPDTRYRRLLLPLYLVLGLGVWWAVTAYGGLAASGLRWWNLPGICLPLLTPLLIIGRRRWIDGAAGTPPANDRETGRKKGTGSC
ncbi:MAG: hypothetical protein JW781_03420 [Deltaproteobacteria bacterium]|nr:hypothetical protein [Candidatus Anaeroferrophillacea bacterium]